MVMTSESASAAEESVVVNTSVLLEPARHEPANETELKRAGASHPRASRRSAVPRSQSDASMPSCEAPATDLPRPDVLTVDELADLLRLERKTVYACISRGEIPGVRRLGGAIRIHREAVLRWLAEGQGRTPRLRGFK
jgi:excisionase family DNA binding protein